MRFRADPLLAAILALCLVLVQHGALLHRFAHTQGVSAEQLHVDEQHALDSVCGICVAYAPLGAAATVAPAPHVVDGCEEVPTAPVRSFLAARPAAYAARAPPFPV